MVSVEEAASIVFAHLMPLHIETVPFTGALSKVLAEPVVADRDFPPFHRVSMDGIAIRFEEWEHGRRIFFIEGTQAAGVVQKSLDDEKNCMEVMTGAILPDGTDTVIRYEDVEIKEGYAHILLKDLVVGKNIHFQGQDAKAKTVLLEPGTLLSPAEIALLASVGKTQVKVFALPKAAIVGSGDELVDVDATPALHQIRRSNTFALQAAMNAMGWESTTFHLKDDKDQMVSSLKKIADAYDVIILTGGVSMGKYDFVPGALEEIGIVRLFHKVNQKPGKPFWFGKSDKGQIVFALPGNPVSTFMCYFRYIKPWLLKSLGLNGVEKTAVLASDFSFRSHITYFLQVAIKYNNGQLLAYPDAGGGSGDFANLKDVDGFLELPPDKEKFLAGEVFPYIPFRQSGI